MQRRANAVIKIFDVFHRIDEAVYSQVATGIFQCLQKQLGLHMRINNRATWVLPISLVKSFQSNPIVAVSDWCRDKWRVTKSPHKILLLRYF